MDKLAVSRPKHSNSYSVGASGMTEDNQVQQVTGGRVPPDRKRRTARRRQSPSPCSLSGDRSLRVVIVRGSLGHQSCFLRWHDNDNIAGGPINAGSK